MNTGWLWFSAGFSVSFVLECLIAVFLLPKVVERWIERNAMDMIKWIMSRPEMNEILQNYIFKRLWGNSGGRPRSVKGVVKEGAAVAVQMGIGGVLRRVFGQPEGVPTEGPAE
jgi:hypothetical protein